MTCMLVGVDTVMICLRDLCACMQGVCVCMRLRMYARCVCVCVCVFVLVRVEVGAPRLCDLYRLWQRCSQERVPALFVRFVCVIVVCVRKISHTLHKRIKACTSKSRFYGRINACGSFAFQNRQRDTYICTYLHVGAQSPMKCIYAPRPLLCVYASK